MHEVNSSSSDDDDERDVNIVNNVNMICKVCKLEAGGAHKCFKCKCIVHAICGRVEEEGFGKDVLCNVCIANDNDCEEKKKEGIVLNLFFFVNRVTFPTHSLL